MNIYCKTHKGIFIAPDNYTYKTCPRCREAQATKHLRTKPCNGITLIGKKCKGKALVGEKYCPLHIISAKKKEDEENGIYYCSSKYTCDSIVSELGIKCDSCIVKAREYDRNRRNNTEEPPKGMIRCSHGELKPESDFIENGKFYRNCSIHRKANRNMDQKRKGQRYRKN